MFPAIYIEESIRQHPRVLQICQRFPDAQPVYCERYGEIFNRSAQSFRLQKSRPALILASKFDNFVHDAPPAYGIGEGQSFYFSHMLNCLYDCRYCFLQGMLRSANYLLFVNYEDFGTAIEQKIRTCGDSASYFFSGYDCDSLAMEPVTAFTQYFLPLFRSHPGATIELRTKSTQIRQLLDTEAFDNCVVAFSFTPENISRQLEHKVPSVEKRIDAMQRLQKKGWRIGLRFDPLIYQDDFEPQYRQLFQQVFTALDPGRIHSVSIGAFRMPEGYFRNMTRMFPDEKLFAHEFEKSGKLVSYPSAQEEHMVTFCHQELANHIDEPRIFHCPIQ